MRIAFRWRVRTLMIAVLVASLAVYGSILFGRWKYHRLLVTQTAQYRRTADAMFKGADDLEEVARDVDVRAASSPFGLGSLAEKTRKQADWTRRQAKYFDELAEMGRRGAERPWYESTVIPLPPHLAQPPLQEATSEVEK